MTIDNVTAFLYDCIDHDKRIPHPEELFDKFQEVDRDEIVKEVKFQAKSHDLTDLRIEWDYLKEKEHAAPTKHALNKSYYGHYTKGETK